MVVPEPLVWLDSLPPMPRTSRAESQVRTRQRLIATAKAMFLDKGYHATSLDAVAEAAGYSKGAVYSNFRNKDQLCLAVLEDIHAGEVAAIEEIFTGASTVHEGIAVFEQWLPQMLSAEGRTILGVGFGIAVRDSPELRAELAAMEQRMIAAVARLISSQAARLGLTPLLPAEDVAAVLVGLRIGIGMQRVLDPEAPIHLLADTMRVLAGVEALDNHAGSDPS